MTQRITGTQRYSHEIVGQLDTLLASSPGGWPQVTLLVPPTTNKLPEYRAVRVAQVGRGSGRLWEQIELPFHARGGVLFTPCGGAPVLHRRNVVTIHDAAVFAAPDGYSSAYRGWYRWLYRSLCKSALHIFTVSHFSKSELLKYCGADPGKITVTYLGSEHAARDAADSRTMAEYGLTPFKYVFTVSSRSPNKNIDGIVRAYPFFGADGLDLVIAGEKNASIFGPPATLPSVVVDVGYVSDATLRSLYENAACFVFPSFYEGFGLPPLEAMAAGCPTVVSRTTSLGEIFGGAAFLCDPDDPRDIACKIIEASRATVEDRKSYKRFASGFQWESCAKTTWSMVAELCERSTIGRVVGRSAGRGTRGSLTGAVTGRATGALDAEL